MNPTQTEAVPDRTHDHARENKRAVSTMSVSFALDSKLLRLCFSILASRATKRKAHTDTEDIRPD